MHLYELIYEDPMQYKCNVILLYTNNFYKINTFKNPIFTVNPLFSLFSFLKNENLKIY